MIRTLGTENGAEEILRQGPAVVATLAFLQRVGIERNLDEAIVYAHERARFWRRGANGDDLANAARGLRARLVAIGVAHLVAEGRAHDFAFSDAIAIVCEDLTEAVFAPW